MLTEDKMSPLSNYCENTNLTPTNTCMPSSKLDILQFKMLCFLVKKKKKKNKNEKNPTKQKNPANKPRTKTKTKKTQRLFYNHYYFLKFCLFTWQFCHISFNSYATFQYFTWVDTEINTAQYLHCQPGLWIKTHLQQVCKWCQIGGKMVNTLEGIVQRGCEIPILGDFQDSIRQVPQQPDLNSKLVLLHRQPIWMISTSLSPA